MLSTKDRKWTSLVWALPPRNKSPLRQKPSERKACPRYKVGGGLWVLETPTRGHTFFHDSRVSRRLVWALCPWQ